MTATRPSTCPRPRALWATCPGRGLAVRARGNWASMIGGGGDGVTCGPAGGAHAQLGGAAGGGELCR